jgi:predicted hotdog family 3-hydroxylacyl-ACP dehydratase
MNTLGARTLSHAQIEALVPHRGAMCLLDRMLSRSETRIECTALNHRDPGHPLRTRSGLLASAAIEYAAQAAALHGALGAEAAGVEAAPGFLASARDVRLAVLRLDDLPTAPTATGATADELRIVATRQAGDATRLLYGFEVSHDGASIATGRLAVVLNAPEGAVAR